MAALPTSSLSGAARLVLKIGSSLLVDKATGQLNRAWLESIADELARLQRRGQQVLVVSSGAIALGRPYLGLSRDQRRLEEAQAAACAATARLAAASATLSGTRALIERTRVAAAEEAAQTAATAPAAQAISDPGKAIVDKAVDLATAGAALQELDILRNRWPRPLA